MGLVSTLVLLAVIIVLAFFVWRLAAKPTVIPPTIDPAQLAGMERMLKHVQEVSKQIQEWAPETLEGVKGLHTATQNLHAATRKLATVDHLVTVNKNLATVNQAIKTSTDQMTRMNALVQTLATGDSLVQLDASVRKLGEPKQPDPIAELNDSLVSLTKHANHTNTGVTSLQAKMTQLRTTMTDSTRKNKAAIEAMQRQIDALMFRLGVKVLPQIVEQYHHDDDVKDASQSVQVEGVQLEG